MKNVKLMMITLMMCLIFTNLFSQTITEPPVYTNDYTGLTIKKHNNGLHWMYKNPKYNHYIDILSFTTKTLQESVDLLNEAVKVLDMGETSKSSDIRHSFKGIEITRYGFNQDAVYLNRLKLYRNECLAIKATIEFLITNKNNKSNFDVFKQFNLGDSVIYNDGNNLYEAIIIRVVNQNYYYLQYNNGTKEPKAIFFEKLQLK